MRTGLIRLSILTLGFVSVGCGGSDDGSNPPASSVGSCTSAFTACAGDPTGTWKFSQACVEGTLAAVLNARLFPEAACANTVTDATMKMSPSSTVTYDGATFSRTGSAEIQATLKVTAACMMAKGLASPSAFMCGAFQDVVKGTRPGTTATCSFADAACDCTTVTNEQINDSGSYTVSGSTITEGNGDSYQFCVSGGQMSQSGPVATDVTGIAQWTK